MRFFADVIDDAKLRPKRWLDAGAGDGWLARTLAKDMPEVELVCWDKFYTDEDLTRLRAESGKNTYFMRSPPEGPFDLITALDVLEHVPDDRAFLRELVERLAPGGSLLISVPTWQALFSSHDEKLAHFRRYQPSEIQALIESEPLRIERGGGLFHSLLPVRVAQKAVELVSGPPEDKPDLGWNKPRWVTDLIGGALRLDAKLSQSRVGKKMPGLSYWALARPLSPRS